MNRLDNIRQKPESYKRGVALGLSVMLTLVIALGWAGQKGMIGGGTVAEGGKGEKASLTASVGTALTPIESSKHSFASGFEEIKKTYQSFKDSLSDVLVPFVTGIEVYEKK